MGKVFGRGRVLQFCIAPTMSSIWICTCSQSSRLREGLKPIMKRRKSHSRSCSYQCSQRVFPNLQLQPFHGKPLQVLDCGKATCQPKLDIVLLAFEGKVTPITGRLLSTFINSFVVARNAWVRRPKDFLSGVQPLCFSSLGLLDESSLKSSSLAKFPTSNLLFLF